MGIKFLKAIQKTLPLYFLTKIYDVKIKKKLFLGKIVVGYVLRFLRTVENAEP